MTMADVWGITDGYEDALGVWRPTAPKTRTAMLQAMGVDPMEGGRPPDSRVWVVRQGTGGQVTGPGRVRLENGAAVEIKRKLPRDLPLGYHYIDLAGEVEPVRLIVVPRQIQIPDWLPAWGWAVQLYGARSRESWGIGDLADLRRLARWSAEELGAGILLVSPLGAVSPVVPQTASPYSPSSRRFLNLIYIRIEEVPGAAEAIPDLNPLIEQGRALNQSRKINRDAVFKLKLQALELLWRRFGGAKELDFYVAQQGHALEEFAVFCALSERYGGDWRTWPSPFRHPGSAEVARFGFLNKDRIRFHQYVQWLADLQLERGGTEIPLIHDMAIGFEPGGADAWVWQDLLATNVSIGAPPDNYNIRGQDWGLPPFVPYKLRGAAYEPFIQTVRRLLRHAKGLRIDHVMGMFRLFWVPQGMEPAMGAYVAYPSEELLGILALESLRAGALVVGEDLGTVERQVRHKLRGCRVLSYRLLWFETRHPRKYPKMALAAITTHDLPTICGMWTGSDLRAQMEIGLKPNQKGMLAIRQRLQSLTGLADDASLDEVIQRSYRLLSEAPSLIVTATLEDALAVEERPNMPGTISEWPNWSLALPSPLDEIETQPLASEIGQALNVRRKSPG